MNNVLLTPTSTPPPQSGYRCPPSAESRIGIYLGETLQLKSILGTGAYGVVYSAVDHSTGFWYAVKALSKYTATGEKLDQRADDFQKREIHLHYAASAHPNIVSMLKIVEDTDCTYIVLEFCPGGDLFSNITEKSRYMNNDALVRKAFLQILDAVEHCHRLGIYHRDLKPENILVSNDGSDVLLADFGLATTDVESDDHGCGSVFYMSPECLDHSKRPSYRCAPNDIWSLGVILVNLVCGRNPWKAASLEDATYKAFTRNPRFLLDILPMSVEVNNILCRIFERNPEDRITIGELKRSIKACQHFSPVPATGLATPPDSPHLSAQQQASPISTTVSMDSDYSDYSDEAISDCDSLSAPSSPASDCDFSDYGSMSGEEVSPRKIQRPQGLATKQQYVIPSQDSQPRVPVQKSMASSYVAPYNPWLCQAWVSNGWPYGQVQPVPQVYRSAPYAHNPYTPFQHAGDGYYY